MKIPKPNKTQIIGRSQPWWEAIALGIAYSTIAILVGLYIVGVI